MSNLLYPDWNQLTLLGGRLCLDFCNTVEREGDNQTEEYLTDYAALVGWGLHTQILTPQWAETLLQQAENHNLRAGAVFQQAIALRESLYKIFTAIANGEVVLTADLKYLNAALGTTMNHLQLVPTASGFNWSWQDEDIHLEQILWPVVRSAAELLTDQALSRVRQCAARDCGWLFLDLSRNRSRRWCDMETCGNRNKARHHYQQQQLRRKS